MNQSIKAKLYALETAIGQLDKRLQKADDNLIEALEALQEKTSKELSAVDDIIYDIKNQYAHLEEILDEEMETEQ